LDIDKYYGIIAFIISLLVSAFLTGAEASILLVEKSALKDLHKKNPLIGSYLDSLLENSKHLILTILIFNTLAKVLVVFLAVSFALDSADYFSVSIPIVLVVNLIVTVFLLVTVCEVLPKYLSSKYVLQYSKIASIPLFWLSILTFPLIKLFYEFAKIISVTSKFNRKKDLEAEIKELAKLNIDNISTKEDERGLISGLVAFRSVTVREVMTPRVDVVAVSKETGFDELMQIIIHSMHSRIPLYKDNLDSIIGIIYAKDLLPYQGNDDKRKNLDLEKIARKVMFVPESKLINDLMREFQAKKMHVAVVVDEFGGTSGLVSLEDILEEIVGEISDEYDNDEEEIKKLSQKSYLILGKASVADVKEKIGIDLSSKDDEFDTLGGFVLHHAGFIPDEGYNFIYKNYKFIVKEVENRRVKKIQIECLQDK